MGRGVERGGGADRGVGAGEGEGGEAARRVRRPGMEAQAPGHRRRRLLGDLPLLPLAAVLNTRTQPTKTAHADDNVAVVVERRHRKEKKRRLLHARRTMQFAAMIGTVHD